MGWFGPSEDFAGLGCRKGILQGMYRGLLGADGGEGNERKDRGGLCKREAYDENEEA